MSRKSYNIFFSFSDSEYDILCTCLGLEGVKMRSKIVTKFMAGALSVMCAITAVVAFAPPSTTVQAAGRLEYQSGICGGAKYTLYNDGVLEIEVDGNGRTTTAVGLTANLDIKEIIVGEGITEIADSMFSECTNVQKVSLPSTVRTIGSYAFNGCTSLKTVTSATTRYVMVDPYAFRDCVALEKIDFLCCFQRNAMNGCSNLESVFMCNDVVSTGTFTGCDKLKTIYYHDEWEEFPKNKNAADQRAIINAASIVKRGKHEFTATIKPNYQGDGATYIYWECKHCMLTGSTREGYYREYFFDKYHVTPEEVGLPASILDGEPAPTDPTPSNPTDPTPVPTPTPDTDPTPAPSGNTSNPFADDFAPAMIEQPVVYPNTTADPATLDCKFYHQNGKSYWYEHGVRQGTYDDPKGVIGDGTVRGREVCDMETAAWYWCDSVLDGAKAINKEVWMPYIYQDEKSWNDGEIRQNAAASIDEHADMSAQLERDIKAHTGKWVRYNANGKMFKGWYKVTSSEAQYYPKQVGNIYYYDPKTGLMAKGDLVIDGVSYHFDETSGVLQK